MENRRPHFAIAIDGPAASGKTTVGFMLANTLNYLFLDTGCMYRAVTLAALLEYLSIEDEESVTALAETVQMDMLPAGEFDDGRLYTVILEGKDVTWALRSKAIDSNVSQVSAYIGVRNNLVNRQREIATRGRVVMVGRDIGTVVLPDAPLKIYLIATADERAARRWKEQCSRDDAADYDQIWADMRRRDRFDGGRRHSPMRPADDAIIVDTTGQSPSEVVRAILALDQLYQRSN